MGGYWILINFADGGGVMGVSSEFVTMLVKDVRFGGILLCIKNRTCPVDVISDTILRLWAPSLEIVPR